MLMREKIADMRSLRQAGSHETIANGTEHGGLTIRRAAVRQERRHGLAPLHMLCFGRKLRRSAEQFSDLLRRLVCIQAIRDLDACVVLAQCIVGI